MSRMFGMATTVEPEDERDPLMQRQARKAPFVLKPIAHPKSTAVERPVERDVYIYLNILSVSAISTSSETFQAHFYVRASWVEPGLKSGELPKNTAASWKPDIMFMNADQTPEILDESFGEVPWREAPDGGAVLQWRAKFRGMFHTQFKLRAFPFDIQDLLIVITSQKQHTYLYEDAFDGTKSILRSEFLILPEFSLDQPLLQPHSELALGKYAILDVKIVARRQFYYHICNIYFPLFLLTCMLFSAFAIDVTDSADRISVTLTVVLASVAYKYIVSQDLPHISYLTLCDMYVLGSFTFTALFVFLNARVGMRARLEVDEAEKHDSELLYLLLACFLAGNVIYAFGAFILVFCERRAQAANMLESGNDEENSASDYDSEDSTVRSGSQEKT